MLRNDIGEEGANAIVDVAKGKLQLATLCGFKPDQTKADLSRQGLKVGDAILLAFDLKKHPALVSLKCVLAFGLLSIAADTRNPPSLAVSSRTDLMRRPPSISPPVSRRTRPSPRSSAPPHALFSTVNSR